jgi:hypothetical protein
MAEVIDTLKNDYGKVQKTITTRNPLAQANAMVEQAHQTVGNMIRSQNFQAQDIDLEDLFLGILSAEGFAMQATVHTTCATPSQLVFNRDAIHNVGFKADWHYIKNRKQSLINKNNKRENATHILHTYQVRDLVVIKADENRKYDTHTPYSTPRTIEKVYANQMVLSSSDKTPNEVELFIEYGI